MGDLKLHTPVCDLLGIEYPIFLAGMGIVARPELVAAVSNAGGLGVMGGRKADSKLPSPEEWRQLIRQIRSLTDKPFGVDMILPSQLLANPSDAAKAVPQEHRDYVRRLKDDLSIPEPTEGDKGDVLYSIEYAKAALRVICEERVPVFASGLGLPDWVVPMCREAGIKVMSVVGNVKNARRVAAQKPDIIVAQGHDAGGHTGRIGTFNLVPQVVDAISPTPVLAAGGIGDGRGLAAALALGAQGVWCGTLFIATTESEVHASWKEKVVEMTEEDTRITKSFTGKTMRAIRNRWTDEWERAPVQPLPFPYQPALVEDVVRIGARTGSLDYANMPTGQVAGMIREIKPAGQVVREMVEQAVEIMSRSLPAATGR